MGNKSNNPQDNFHNPQPGTYQTGVTNDVKKRSNALVAVLLVLTIFLGGLASGLGLVNIRLVQQLMAQTDPSIPMHIYTPSTGASSSMSPIPADDAAEPVLPESNMLTLTLKLPPRSHTAADMSPEDIYAQRAVSMVQVDSSTHHNTCSGTGLVLSQDGYILTNAHLVDSAKRIYVTLHDGRQYRATLVGSDALTDLAVLYIEAEGLTPAEFSDPKHLLVGSSVVSTCTRGVKESCPLSSGMLTASHLTKKLGNYKLTLMQTTVGSDSGPLFNAYGQVVGLNTCKAEDIFGLVLYTGNGYAIPSSTVQSIVEELTANGFVAGRPTLGIRTEAISKFYQQHWDIPGGLWIFSVTEQAQAMGLQESDILLAINGVPMLTGDHLYKVLFSHDIGDELRAVVYRDGERITLNLTVFDTAA